MDFKNIPFFNRVKNSWHRLCSKVPLPKWFKMLLKEIVIPIFCALIVIQYVIQAFQIPSGSMEDTLKTGDFILGLKFTYGSPVPFSRSKFPGLTEPKSGDVVIFRYPGDPAYPDYDYERYTHLADALMFGNFYWDKNPLEGNPHLVHYADGPKDYIKRCVAVSGDTVEVRKGILYKNGKELREIPGKGKYSAYSRTAIARDSLNAVRIPAPGDVIDLSKWNLSMLWWIRSLMVQETPEDKVELELKLFKDSVEVPHYTFQGFRVPAENDRGDLLQELFSHDKMTVYRGEDTLDFDFRMQSLLVSRPGEKFVALPTFENSRIYPKDVVCGFVDFSFFAEKARTGFIPRLNPDSVYSGWMRPVSYTYFEGAQLEDLERYVAEDSSLSLKARLLVNGEPVSHYTVKYPVYFMMGDNRDQSADSRYWGFVSKRNVKAKAFVVYFSFENADGEFSFGNPLSWAKIPFKIRWSRIGKIIHMIGE